MLPDSNKEMGEPERVSVRAGMRPLGLMARNQGCFCSMLRPSIL